jgi:putative transposase
MCHGSITSDRKSIRLKEYDYSQPGEYFITICTHNHECMFGEIVSGEMRLNEFGEIAEEEWFRTEIIRSNVKLDSFAIMPNHIYGIIVLIEMEKNPGRDTSRRVPTIEQFGKPTTNSIPTIVRLFKSAAAKRINEMRNTPSFPVWQSRFYDRIIRNDRELNNIRDYIQNNVLRWAFDKNDPETIPFTDYPLICRLHRITPRQHPFTNRFF